MLIHVTSRHFKAHPSLVTYAEEAVRELSHFYDRIIKGEVILSFEKAQNSVKSAEVKISVYNAILTATGRTEDFFKSVDVAVAKVLVQLKKYKSRLHERDRKAVRKVRQKV